MNRVILVLVSLVLGTCGTVSTSSNDPVSGLFAISVNRCNIADSLIDFVTLGIRFKPVENYDLSRLRIEQTRHRFQDRYRLLSEPAAKNELLDSAGEYITSALINDIIPHWYGTVWDFNGHTENPRKGKIACGYFVSTTLTDAGFVIDRYNMAQQGGYYEARTLQADSLLKIIDNEPGLNNFEIVKKLTPLLNDGLYFLGLNCHVGYLFVTGGDFYFIHSNYIDGFVMIEKAQYSKAFSSSIYIVAELTNNRDLITNWILGDSIHVVMN